MQAYLAEDTEKAILLDMLGYDELWVGEHFTAGTEPYPSPLMFMANLLAHAKRITFATGVINAPNRHPAHVAAEAAQFDHMSAGRFILGDRHRKPSNRCGVVWSDGGRRAEGAHAD